MAFMQDSLMSSRQEWRFFLYDGLGRLAVQGICTGWGPDAELRSPWTSFQTGQSSILNTGYSVPYEITNPTLEIANYYDGYQFLEAGVFAAGRTQLDAGAGSRSACVTTLQTAQVVSIGTGLPVLRVMYYDEKGRVTECREKGIDGYMTTSSTSYSFTDKPLQCTTRVYRNGALQDSICRTCAYSQATDMLTGVQLSVNGSSPVTVASYSYDALGRMTSCSMGDGTATTSLSYDLHGWVTQKKTLGSNGGNLFEENLYYADGGGTPCYNGNISSVAYKSAGSAQYLGHRYLYDGLDRLISAKYYMGNPGILTMQTGYTEEVEYNANSAITRMVRHGKGDSGMDLIDDMHYTYTGNRLKAVVDSASALHYAGSFDYKDGAQTSTEYMYNGNGALLYDRNKNVSFMSYDKNGMPQRVQFRDGSSTEYLYAADGTRLRKIHKTAVSGITAVWSQWKNLTASQILSADTTLYVGGFEVSSSGLSKYYFENGYLTIDRGPSNPESVTGDIAYHYLATDHLGSVRTVVGDDGSVEQRNNYYPYGGLLNDVTNTMDVQTRKYNGKELDRMHGLDLYDYSARQYDAALGCFTSMDPLCEKYYHISPYAYCAGNPVKYVDPDGKDWKNSDDHVIKDTKNIKVFIFYSTDFVDQAKVQYNDATKEFGKNSVAMSLTSTDSEFYKDWGDMDGTEIANVIIMTHGKNQSIVMDDGSQLTSTGDGQTNLNANKAMNIQDLPTPKGNISKAELSMYSCHSADKKPQKHGEGVHAQGELKGSKLPIAYAFAQNFSFKHVRGTTESVNYHSFFTDGTPTWSNNYYKPYPANGEKWTIIKRSK